MCLLQSRYFIGYYVVSVFKHPEEGGINILSCQRRKLRPKSNLVCFFFCVYDVHVCAQVWGALAYQGA